jgi:hypothetical protein
LSNDRRFFCIRLSSVKKFSSHAKSCAHTPTVTKYFRSTTSPKLTKKRLLKLYRASQLLTGTWNFHWKSVIGTLQSWGSTRATVVKLYPPHSDWRTGLKKGTAFCRAVGLEHNPDMHYIPGKMNGVLSLHHPNCR